MLDWYMTVQQCSGVTPNLNVTSHITRHHITYVTAGGNNSRHICRDARFLVHQCPQSTIAAMQWSGTNKSLNPGHWGNIGFSCVRLDHLLIAPVCTLIAFVCQVIGEPLLQSDGHPDTFQPTIFLSLQSQPSTYVTHEGSCRIPNINLQTYP